MYYTYLYNIIIPKLTVSGGLKEETIYIDTQQSPGDLFMAFWRGAQPHATLPERPFPRSYGMCIQIYIYIYTSALHPKSEMNSDYTFLRAGAL